MNDSAKNNNDDYKNKAVTYADSKSQVQPSPSTLPGMSMGNFLDFLAAAYRLNDALENYPLETYKKSSSVDWNQFNSCTFVSLLFLNNVVDKQSQRKSLDDSFQEEVRGKHSSKLNWETVERSEQCSSERVDGGWKNCVRQSTKRGDKHKRGRSASLVVSNANGRSEKYRVDKRRSSFAKRETIENKSKIHSTIGVAERQAKRKLSEVLQEGILDSVLPYVVPKQNVITTSTKCISVGDKKNGYETFSSSSSGQSKENISVFHPKKQIFFMTDNSKEYSAKDIEVEIHVCDEVKNVKKDFRCSQALLVAKMGYFAEVTTGQNLEDMDISVHCDITIFEWLMKWVKKDSARPELPPQLDVTNVIPILVSAAFLQMDPLLNDCLAFCQVHMNDILRQATNLTCLNESIVTRLANRFSNVEIEEMRDKRDKLQTRLFCKLISFLGELEPELKHGHFTSLAYMFKCIHCHEILPQSLSPLVCCQRSNNTIDGQGQVLGVHLRNPNWSVTEWIKQVRSELGCWRSVYWRLWGQSHWQYCSICHLYYPVSRTSWCCFHPDSPQFFIMDQHRTTSFPIGRFPCCGERAYRYEALKNSNGCKFRPHIPVLESNESFAIQKIFHVYRNVIALEEPQERLIDGGYLEDNKECVLSRSVWWFGMELAPSSYKATSLISRAWEKTKEANDTCDVSVTPIYHSRASDVNQPVHSEVLGSSDKSNSSPDDTERDSSSSMGEDNSDNSLIWCSPVHTSIKKTHSMAIQCPNQPNQWLPCYSTRYNQDSLREYEEWSLGAVVNLLSRRHTTAPRGRWATHITPLGGTYVRLDAQWREGHIHLFQGTRAAVVTNLKSQPARVRPKSNLH